MENEIALAPLDILQETRRALGREPTEHEQRVLSTSRTLAELRMRLADFPEVYLDPSVRRAFELSQLRRLAGPRLDVQVDCTADELGRLFTATERAWERLGDVEPYWSVVTSDNFRTSNIAESNAQFYESSNGEVRNFLHAFERAGIDSSRIENLLEIGCGVGRMTHVFAKHFHEVTAVDISAAHLRLAKAEMDRRNVTNVRFRKVSSPRDYRTIEGYDGVYTFIALQHSPPPIIVDILKTVLGNLKPGGCAYFHLPTYIEGYSFTFEDYLATTKGEMEMHCVPQKRIFELLQGMEILEVINDGSGGDHRFELMRFFVRKPMAQLARTNPASLRRLFRTQ